MSKKTETGQIIRQSNLHLRKRFKWSKDLCAVIAQIAKMLFQQCLHRHPRPIIQPHTSSNDSWQLLAQLIPLSISISTYNYHRPLHFQANWKTFTFERGSKSHLKWKLSFNSEHCVGLGRDNIHQPASITPCKITTRLQKCAPYCILHGADDHVAFSRGEMDECRNAQQVFKAVLSSWLR